jgi:hypothetical protein
VRPLPAQTGVNLAASAGIFQVVVRSRKQLEMFRFSGVTASSIWMILARQSPVGGRDLLGGCVLGNA